MNAIFTFKENDMKNIISGKKMLLFGNKISKTLQGGSKIYLSNGQKVIGECFIKDRVPLKYYKLGAYPFMLHFAKYIKKDPDLEASVEYIYNYDLPSYNASYKLEFLYLHQYLDFIKAGNTVFYLLDMPKKEHNEYLQKKKLGDKAVRDCDRWLKEIGYYNENDESFFKEYIEIEKVNIYNTPKEITSFIKKDGQYFEKTPKIYALCK